MINHYSLLIVQRAFLLAVIFGVVSAKAQERVFSNADNIPLVRFALLIGNADYNQDGKITDEPSDPERLRDLPNACNDVELIGAELIKLGWKEDKDVTVKCSVGKMEMQGLINDFLQRFQDSNNALALFYFAGHGMQVGKESLIFGTNAKLNVDRAAEKLLRNPNIQSFFPASAYRLNGDLVSSVGEITKQGAMLIVLDACRDNPIYEKLRGKPINIPITAPKKLDNVQGLKILYATEGGEFAYDGIKGKTSPFASMFAQEMKGDIPLANVVENIVREVSLNTNSMQTPEEKGFFWNSESFCLKECKSHILENKAEVEISRLLTSLKRSDHNWYYVPNISSTKARFVQVADNSEIESLSHGGGNIIMDSYDQGKSENSQSIKSKITKDIINIYSREELNEKLNLQEKLKLRFDIFWCSGDPLEEKRELLALRVAKLMQTAYGRDVDVSGSILGSIRVRELTPEFNDKPEYQLEGNYVKYDQNDKFQKIWKQAFEKSTRMDFETVPRKQELSNYIAVYLCGNAKPARNNPLVYVQIARKDQTTIAKKSIRSIQKALPDFLVAKQVDLQVIKSPSFTEVRYFHKKDKEKADQLLQALKPDLGEVVKSILVRNYEASVRPNTFEIWLGKDVDM